ncbi:hypothetical protein [Kaarinaea lacus]
MRNGNFSVTVLVVILVVLSIGLTACESSKTVKTAPIGDHAVLEQLATAYRSVAAEYPVQPSSMRPKAKKEFVERVFKTAGYHYGATLTSFARQGVDITNQDQRDLADLLFLPHRGLGEDEMKNIYSADELAAIHLIQAGLK